MLKLLFGSFAGKAATKNAGSARAPAAYPRRGKKNAGRKRYNSSKRRGYGRPRR
ncbi:hypothetical protein [Gordoniibacillus kamchatkensis]|uniref:hypothetical protein n=1 Tax=Gordoniibacillus kamchatkensis TaxID=1590651 RepID=UPI0022B0A04A|nr:hypothetical protein [Paenibacillus sp. VKM B-2647]